MKAICKNVSIMNPTSVLDIHIYPSVYFSSLCCHKQTTNPTCVKIYTGYFITVVNGHVICKLSLQTETAHSTMES